MWGVTSDHQVMQVKESEYLDYRISWWMIDVAYLDLMNYRRTSARFLDWEKVDTYDLTTTVKASLYTVKSIRIL